MGNLKELKPCPFCGVIPKIYVCDDEGNLHEDDYEKDPWSGLGFQINHTIEDAPHCPIASHPDESVGTRIYNSKEELAEEWNKRI